MAGGSTSAAPAASDPYAYSAELVRSHDRDRYVCDLLAPQEVRRHLFALHAFNAEIAHIRDVVSDPMLGEIRLQWWRDAILDGAGGGQPVATALTKTIATFSLPTEAFARLLDARVFDFYADPMPTLIDLEGYAGDTSSSLIQLAAVMLAGGTDPGSADAAGHAGVAYALTGIMRAFARNVRHRQSFLPEAMLNSRCVDEEAMLGGKTTPELRSLLTDLRTIARQHLSQAELRLPYLDPAVRPAFLPLALVRPYLDRMDRATYDPFSAVDLPPWRRQWIIWRAARRM